MIISHLHKFIFIKTRKTAGTSIEVFLSQICGPNDTVTPIGPHVEPHIARNYKGFWNPLPGAMENRGRDLGVQLKDLARARKFYNHIPAVLVRSRVSRRVWREYFKFCVERNPWDKTLSHYYMLRDRAQSDITFDEYLNSGLLCVDHPKYTDYDGALIVDKVINYESLNDGLAEVFGALGVPFEGRLNVRAKSEHRKIRQPYQEGYSDRQKALVANAFQKEIELHNYVF